MKHLYEKIKIFRRSIGGSLFGLILIAACTTELPFEEPPVFKLSVNATLFAGTSEQRLSIARVVQGTPDSVEFVQDAIVEVNGVRFDNIPAGQLDPLDPYNWVTTNLTLACGQVCSLRIRYEGQLITGFTRIPDSPVPVEATGSVIRWQADSLHSHYAITLNGYENTDYVGNSFDARDSYFKFEAGDYHIRLVIYDENYRATYGLSTGGPALLSAGMNGAYGFFSSACVWEGVRRLE